MAGCITEEEMKSILSRFSQYSNIMTFIETGTFRAETILKMCNLFSNCHTIELSRELYEQARKQKSGSSITFHNGDSVKILEELIPQIKEPAIFFLDAHWCGRESAKGNLDVPLIEEIKLIAKRMYSDLLIIDDFRLFSTNTNEDWKIISVKAILNILRGKISYWKRLIPRSAYSVRNDRMIIPL
jgi:hypothetical protein